MSALLRPALPAAPAATVYPESDGKPMADNSKQLRWIVVLFGNLSALFRAVGDVLVGGNLLWYARDDPLEPPQAPDVFVAFGRPKGDRGSYRQWEEGGVPLTVVFEVLFPGNTAQEMADKFAFYDEYGVEEYYIYNPDANRLQAFVRRGEALVRARKADGFVSPRLGIRFDLSGPEMTVFYPNGEPFLSFEELKAQHEREQALRKTAEQRAARLAELSRKARRGQASAEEAQELERLEEELAPPAPP
jgi:Uma2 family endonuclease